MEVAPKLFFSKVMHKRILPRENKFTYKMYYLAFPLSKIDDLKIPLNKFAPLSFFEKDHGKKDGSNINVWAKDQLNKYSISADGEIILITLPRIFGYVFNPVSFYFCFDLKKELKAVICEVNNTFGETHTYVCAKDNNETISSRDLIEGEKLFHVSPFLEREGKYQFRFDYKKDKLGIWIDFYDGKGNKKLVTSLTGIFQDLNKKNLRKAFWRYPIITFKTIILIHWQAIKLVSKKVKYINKPKQLKINSSQAKSLKKVNDQLIAR